MINENLIFEIFQSYLQKKNIQDAVEETIESCVNEDMTDGKTFYVVDQVLIPPIIRFFAEQYDEMTNCYDYTPDEDNLNAIFETFCQFEGLSEPDLQSTLAMAINEAAAQDDDDDDDFVFNPGTRRPYKAPEWAALSDEERQAKVKKFLKKLANAHLDMRDMKPFIKTLDVGPNPYGVKYTDMTKTFDRKANRYGHGPGHGPNSESLSEGTISFPDPHNQGHDEEHKDHPLHNTCCKFGYNHFKTTPVHQKDGSVFNHHLWINGPHQIGAYHNDVNWSTKVSNASGHVWTGTGVKELEAHLKSKAKKYKKNQNESVAHVPMLESLLDPTAHARVQRYADFINKNPAKTFGVVDKTISPAQELKESWKRREEHEEKFGQGKDQNDWSLFDWRSGRPK